MDPIRTVPDDVPPDNRTLGWDAIEWADEWLTQPDGPNAGDRWKFTPEQVRILLRWFEIDDRGDFVQRRGVLRRMKGWGKDPFLAALSAIELLGPCRFGGWNDDGTPIVVPQQAAWIQIAAVNQDQTRNTMTLFPGLFSKACIAEYGIDLGKTIIYSGSGGRIEAVTSSPRALEGGRPTFVVLNETQHWLRGNDGLEMSDAIARNAAKIRGGAARSLAITNAHSPGEDSVAERDHEAFMAIRDGRSIGRGFYYDSIEAPSNVDLADREELYEGLVAARGDSDWLNLDRIIEEFYDPSRSPGMCRRFYLNQIAEAETAWLAPHEWAACGDSTVVLADKDMVTLGFDGSVRDDSTALVACRVEDGALVILDCWEKPEGPQGNEWQVDRSAVDTMVKIAFDRFNVVGMYADPAHWQDYLDRWNALYGDRLRVRATQTRPLEWWTNRQRIMIASLERFHEAVLDQKLIHDNNHVLTRHVLNAQRRTGRSGITIAKEHPGSHRKIDAAMAAVLAYEARCDAIAGGVSMPSKRSNKLFRF